MKFFHHPYHNLLNLIDNQLRFSATQSLFKIIFTNAILVFFYVSLGHLTIHFFSNSDLVVPTIFIPEGIALAAAIYYGIRIIPGIFVGQFILLWLNHASTYTCIGVSAVNSLEAILAILLVQKFRINPGFEHISDLVKFYAMSLLVLSPFSSLASNLFLNPSSPWINHFENLVSYWIGNGIAQVIVSPILLTLFYQPKQFNFAINNVLMVMLTIVAIFIKFTFDEVPIWVFISIVIPLVTFISFKSKLHELCSYILIITLYLLATMSEHNPQLVSANNLIHLDFIILAITLSQTFLACLVMQNRKSMEQIDSLSKRQHYLLQNNPVIIYSCRPFGDYGATYISPNIESQFGYTPDQFLSRSDFWISHVHPDDRAKLIDDLPLLFKYFSHTHTYRYETATGEYLWVEDRLKLLHDEQGKPIEIVGSMMIISHLINESFEIHDIEKDLINIIQNSSNPMVLNDLSDNPRVLFANRQFVKAFGYELEEIPTVDAWAKLAYPDEHYRKKIFNEWYRRINNLKINEETTDSQEVIVTCKDGSKKVVLISANNIKNYTLITLVDISAIRESQNNAENKRQSLELRFDYLNRFDPLTNLPNQSSAITGLEQLRASVIKNQNHACLILIDLDHFKLINESYGRKTGDFILVNLAMGIKKLLSKSQTLYRLYKDEFLILADNTESKKAKQLAADIIHLINQGVRVTDGIINLTACIGIVEISSETSPSEDLITRASSAKDIAKSRGKNSIELILEDIHTPNLRRLELLQELKRAIINHEFVVYFQPQIDLTTGKIIGAEALIRWLHPQHGLILPEIFIPLAEQNNLIGPIGKFVLIEACMQAKAWLKKGVFLSSMSVNLSPLQFKDRYFKKFVFDTLKKMNLDPSILDLELTESALIYDDETIFKTIADLRAKGIKLSVDDFGTGYSSMSYLRMFEIDRIKIDKSFVLKMLHTKEDYAIVQSIIDLSNRLSIEAIAEGVEDSKTLKALKDLGCHTVQGFLISKAIDANEFAGFYKQYENKPLKL